MLRNTVTAQASRLRCAVPATLTRDLPSAPSCERELSSTPGHSVTGYGISGHGVSGYQWAKNQLVDPGGGLRT